MLENIEENKKILIVDDMKINYLAIKKIVNTQSYETFFENNSLNVLRVTKEIQPAIILLDFEMPDLSGVEVCKLLKSDSETKDIPVLFITSVIDEIKIENAFDAGADDYIIKPARAKELLARMNRILLNRKLQHHVQIQYEEQAMLTRIISHDITNLLTVNQAGVENMFNTSLNALSKYYPEDSKELLGLNKYHKSAVNSIHRTIALIKNIRELQYLDDQTPALNLKPLAVKPLLESCLATFQDKIKDKNIQFKINCDSNIHIIADEVTLSISVINNLISNAIKFSYKGGVIQFKVEEQENKIIVELQDYGMGMNPQILSRIFSKSEKVSRVGTENEKGTGFGMPIVKRYMELYGGSITIRSKCIESYPTESGTQILLSFRKG